MITTRDMVYRVDLAAEDGGGFCAIAIGTPADLHANLYFAELFPRRRRLPIEVAITGPILGRVPIEEDGQDGRDPEVAEVVDPRRVSERNVLVDPEPR